jgi:urease accessory protein UreF
MAMSGIKLVGLDLAAFIEERLKQTALDANKARQDRSWTAVKDLGRDLLTLRKELAMLKAPVAPEMSEEEQWDVLVSALADMDAVEMQALLAAVSDRTGLRVVG